MSAYIKTLKNTDGDIIYPQTKTSAVYTNEGVNIESIFGNPALIDGSAPIIDTTMSVNADTLQGKNWNQMLTNRNLLDNWDFRNPVNQREASVITTSGYGLDRWLNVQGSNITVNDGYITLTATSILSQFIESSIVNALAGKQITISVMDTDSTIHKGTTTYPSFGTPAIVLDDSALQVYIPTANNTLIQFNAKQNINVCAVKLELGSVSTLANDPPADYGEELRKCQRYCMAYGQYAQWAVTSLTADYIDFTISVPVQLRNKPVIINAGNLVLSSNLSNQSGFTYSIAAMNGNNLRLRAVKTGHGLSLPIYLECTGLVLFSSDL